MTFRELDTVVIANLLLSSRQVDGTRAVTRQPRVGDLGAVVHVLSDGQYLVECVDESGRTVWLAEFAASELSVQPAGWQFTVDETSAGAYRARGIGPSGAHVETTDTDPSAAIAASRAFALRHISGKQR
jgi:hypothetical protein